MLMGRGLFAAPARLWMNWPLWGGLLATLLLARHAWVIFSPAEHAVPGNVISHEAVQAGQLFGAIDNTSASSTPDGIKAIGIFAHRTAGFAVLLTPQGQKGVGLGAEVLPGLILAETHADHVILMRNKTPYRVELDAAAATGASLQPVTSSSVAGIPVSAAGKQMAIESGTHPSISGIPELEHLSPEQRALLQQKIGKGFP